MQNSTINKLNEINTHFYNTVATSFDESRNHFWPGWYQLLQYIDAHSVQSVLDIGSGNGRFGTFSLQHFPNIRNYTGIDSNLALLQSSQNQTAPHIAEYHQIDIVTQLLQNQPVLPNKKTFNLITLFGILHHIPSFKLREKLISEASKLLSENGTLAFTTWQFMEYERFKNKLISPETLAIEKSELEENDYFLDWKRGNKAIRYCHYHAPKEITKLIENTSLKVQATFRADGKENNVNCYYVLRKKN